MALPGTDHRRVGGTYSSIYVASTAVLMLGISKADLMPIKKEGAEAGAEP